MSRFPSWTEEMKQTAYEMKLHGKTYGEIAEKIGVSSTSVASHFQKLRSKEKRKSSAGADADEEKNSVLGSPPPDPIKQIWDKVQRLNKEEDAIREKLSEIKQEKRNLIATLQNFIDTMNGDVKPETRNYVPYEQSKPQ